MKKILFASFFCFILLTKAEAQTSDTTVIRNAKTIQDRKAQNQKDLVKALKDAGATDAQVSQFKEIQKTYSSTLKGIRKNMGLTSEQKSQKFKETAQEEDQKIKDMLGIQAYKSFVKAAMTQKQIRLME